MLQMDGFKDFEGKNKSILNGLIARSIHLVEIKR